MGADSCGINSKWRCAPCRVCGRRCDRARTEDARSTCQNAPPAGCAKQPLELWLISGSCRHNEADVVPLVRRSDRARRPRRQEHRDQAHARRHASVSLRQSKAAHGRKQCAHCKKNVTRAAARFGSDESVIGGPTIRRRRSMQSRWSKFATWSKSISATRSGRRCWSRRRRLLARADRLAPSDANRSVALP